MPARSSSTAVSRRRVEAGPAGHAQFGGEGVGHEGMREAQPGGPGGILHQQAGLDRRVEGVERVADGRPGHVGQQVELDRDPEHRGDGEQRLGGRRQHPDPPAHDVDGRGGHTGAAERPPGRSGGPAGEQLDDLAHEEGVPTRALVDEVGHVVVDRRAVGAPAPATSRTSARDRPRRSMRREPVAGGPARRGSRPAGRRRPVPTGRTVATSSTGTDGQGAGDELERSQRRGVGPLEVVDDEEQRAGWSTGGRRPSCCGAVGRSAPGSMVWTPPPAALMPSRASSLTTPAASSCSAICVYPQYGALTPRSRGTAPTPRRTRRRSPAARAPRPAGSCRCPARR